MVKFNANEVAPIEAGNPVWQTVQAWAEMNMERLRNEREKEAVDLRPRRNIYVIRLRMTTLTFRPPLDWS
jgi:hypothetical protein